MMLDLPELLAPARIVSGLTSMDCSSAMDLKPATEILVIPSGFSGDSFFLELMAFAIALVAGGRLGLFEQGADEGLEAGAVFGADDLVADAAVAAEDVGDGQ